MLPRYYLDILLSFCIRLRKIISHTTNLLSVSELLLGLLLLFSPNVLGQSNKTKHEHIHTVQQSQRKQTSATDLYLRRVLKSCSSSNSRRLQSLLVTVAISKYTTCSADWLKRKSVTVVVERYSQYGLHTTF